MLKARKHSRSMGVSPMHFRHGRDAHATVGCRLLLLVMVSISPALAQTSKPTESPKGSPVRGDEITPAQQEAVKKGLSWLAAHQSRDGGYGAMNGPSHAGI